MRKYIFPYGGSCGKGDTWGSEIELELDDATAARLVASAKSEPRWDLDEDPYIDDIYQFVRGIIFARNKQMMLEDGRIDELREFEPDLSIDELVDEDMGLWSVKYPVELQGLEKDDLGEGTQ